MSIKYILRYKKSKDWERPILSIETDAEPGMKESNMPGNIINDDYDGRALLGFINEVLQSKNTTTEYETNGYTLRVEDKDEKKILNIFFRLTTDYPSCHVDPADFKELLKVWIDERTEFERDPIAYKEKLGQKGGVVEE